MAVRLHVGRGAAEGGDDNGGCDDGPSCLVLCIQLVADTRIPRQVTNAVDVVVNQGEGADGLAEEESRGGEVHTLDQFNNRGEISRVQQEADPNAVQRDSHDDASRSVGQGREHREVGFVDCPRGARSAEFLVLLPELVHLVEGAGGHWRPALL